MRNEDTTERVSFGKLDGIKGQDVNVARGRRSILIRRKKTLICWRERTKQRIKICEKTGVEKTEGLGGSYRRNLKIQTLI